MVDAPLGGEEWHLATPKVLIAIFKWLTTRSFGVGLFRIGFILSEVALIVLNQCPFTIVVPEIFRFIGRS